MPDLDRRRLLQTAFAAGLAPKFTAFASGGGNGDALDLIDSNVSLFPWPFRRLPFDEPAALAAKLKSLGVREAWAGSFEGLLHRDLAAVNARLAAACRGQGEGLLKAFGTVNLALPDWREDLRRCRDEHDMAGIRLHPNHHGYTLAHPGFPALLAQSAEAGLLVQIAASTEDTRTQHPQTQVDDVDLRPLPAVLAAQPRARVQVLNHKPSAALTPALATAENLWFDTARTEGTAGVLRLVEWAGREKVMLGSHAPFFIPEAALIRVEEALLAGLETTAADALLRENARRLLAS